MGYIFWIAILILIIVNIIAGLKPKKKKQRYNSRGFDHNRIHKNGTKYDDFGFDYDGYNADGYNQAGYNRFGKNAKGQYNRIYDTKSCDEDGFDNLLNPVVLTDHVQERFIERLGIRDLRKMELFATEAYKFGKSKRQIKKTSAYLVEEIEQKYDNSIALIYKNYIYIFTRENVLKTVFKNDRIPL